MRKKSITTFIIIFIILTTGGGIFAYNKLDQKQTVKQTIKKIIPSITNTKTQVPTPTQTTTPTPTPAHADAINTCNDLLVLVNKTIPLPASYTPPDLVYLKNYGIPVTDASAQVRSILIPDLKRLFTDAANAKINLIIDSPYRSYQTQDSVYNTYVQQSGKAQADQFSAQPGHSQHQLGTAIDFSTNSIANQLDQNFANTPAGQWLLDNAYKYGFYIAYPQGQETVTGYEYEPWHFRYIGLENALSLQQSGLIMETYLQKYGVKPNC